MIAIENGNRRLNSLHIEERMNPLQLAPRHDGACNDTTTSLGALGSSLQYWLGDGKWRLEALNSV